MTLTMGLMDQQKGVRWETERRIHTWSESLDSAEEGGQAGPQEDADSQLARHANKAQ